MASFEGDNLVVFYHLIAHENWSTNKTKTITFGGKGLPDGDY